VPLEGNLKKKISLLLLGSEFILRSACERFVSGYFSTAQVTCCRITGWLWTTTSKRMLFKV